MAWGTTGWKKTPSSSSTTSKSKSSKSSSTPTNPQKPTGWTAGGSGPKYVQPQPVAPPPQQPVPYTGPSQDRPISDVSQSPYLNTSPNYGQGSNFNDPTTGQHVWSNPAFVPTDPNQIAGLQQIAAGGGPEAAAAQSALSRAQPGPQQQQQQQAMQPIGYQGGSWVDYHQALTNQYGGDANAAYQALVDAGMTSEIGGFTAGAQLLGTPLSATGNPNDPNAVYGNDPSGQAWGGYQLDPNAINFNPYTNQWYTGQGEVYGANLGGDYMGPAAPSAGGGGAQAYPGATFDPNAGYYGSQMPQQVPPQQGAPQQGAQPNYGGFIGLPPGTPIIQNFIDNDGDGVDDRWQTGPGQPSQYPQAQPPPQQNFNIPPGMGPGNAMGVGQQPPQQNGYQGPGGGNTYDELAAEYERRLAAGYTGDKFLGQHPKFAENYQQSQQGGQNPGGSSWPSPPGSGGWGSPNAPSSGGQPGGGSDPLGNAGVTPSGQPNTPPEALGLPYSPEFHEAMRHLDDQLAATLLNLGIQEDQIPAMVEQYKQRMLTDQEFEHEAIDESMNERGLFNSGIRMQNRERSDIPRQRQWQDFMSEIASKYSQIANDKFMAQSERDRAKDEMILDMMNALAENPPTTVNQAGNGYPTDFSDEGYGGVGAGGTTTGPTGGGGANAGGAAAGYGGTGAGNSFDDLLAEYNRRLGKGWSGENFLEEHEKFAEKVTVPSSSKKKNKDKDKDKSKKKGKK